MLARFFGAAALTSFLLVPQVHSQNKDQQLPEGQGKAATEKICSGCHAPQIVLSKHETKERWVQIVTDMVNKGANGTDDEFNEIIEYLAAHFPSQSGR